jgi:hypothetical protein
MVEMWRWNSGTAFLVKVSEHKLEYSQTRVFVGVFYPHFAVLQKMLFMNRREFSCFADFFVRIFKTRVDYGFL